MSFAQQSKLCIFLLVIIFIYALAIRLINLNYNSPFTDEAVYITYGRLGIFQGDWRSDVSNWIPGLFPYSYPVLSALSYVIGGIESSRFLNVVFGVLTIELIFVISFLTSNTKKTNPYAAGLISAFLIACLPVSYFISRLATYDMPSFYFFFLSIVFFFWAQKLENNSRLYFLSFILYFVSISLKIITIIYLPLILFFGYFLSRSTSEKSLHFYKRYFLFPVLSVLFIYGLSRVQSLSLFTQAQVVRERIDYSVIISNFLFYNRLIIIPYILGNLFLLLTKQSKRFLVLNVFALWILLFHLFFRRLVTLDKHTFMFLAFSSIVVGQGFASILDKIKLRFIKSFFVFLVFIVFLIFGNLAFKDSQMFNKYWDDLTPVLDTLRKEVNNGDKILAEAEGAPILAVYDEDYPLNVSTFNWFVYRNFTNERAYAEAVNDGYFNLIQITSTKGGSDYHSLVQEAVRSNLKDNYRLVFDQDNYLIYKRNY